MRSSIGSFLRPLLFVSLIMAVLAPASAALKPDQARWERLGMRKVNFLVDRDEIFVTAAEGIFSALQIRVQGAPIDLMKVEVHYKNGDVQNLAVRENIPAGGQTRVIDLAGNKQVITKVVFWYDTKNRARQRATVVLWGRR